MRSMHLGVNTLFHVPGDIGGTETYLREILQALVTENEDLRLTLFTHSDNDDVIRQWLGVRHNIIYCRLPVPAHIRPLRIVAEQTLLPFYVSRSGIELLWSPGYTAPYISKCPQVVTIHDLQYKRYPQDMKWFERQALDRLVKIACSRCSGVITVSEFSKQEVLNYGFAPADKVHAVLEGVNPLFADPVDEPAVKDQMTQLMPDAQPFILCVAHTYPHKNVDKLVEAYNLLLNEIPHNLILVGKPRLGEPDVVKAVKRVDQPSRIYRLQSGVSFNFLRLLYQKADLFVLPSGYEGFGLPILEAMMAGTLVICSNDASLPEVGGVHPFYINELTSENIALQIQKALELSHKDKTARCSEAKKWAGSFTWSQSARKTLSVLSVAH